MTVDGGRIDVKGINNVYSLTVERIDEGVAISCLSMGGMFGGASLIISEKSWKKVKDAI